MVALVACAAQVRAEDDPCLPNAAGIAVKDAKTAATVVPRAASDWDQCKEMGSIAGQVAHMRDSKIAQEEVAMMIWQWFTSLRNSNRDYINQTYVVPIYDSSESWHDICVEYTNACTSAR
jgi:hypothetical protein